MNPDALLTRLRLEQRYLIDIDKKLHELEYLLPGADPVQFLDAAKRTALLSERSTAQTPQFSVYYLRWYAAGLLSASC